MGISIPALQLEHPGDPSFKLDTSAFDLSGEGFACIIGRNGSGKSTFGDVLAGIPQTETEDKWYYLPQHLDRFLFAENVMEQLGSLLAKDIDRGELTKIIDDFGFFKPDEMLNFPFLLMSGGERRRMALVCVLYLQPRRLILDEPEIGVTLKENMVLLSNLHNLTANHAQILVISHNYEFVSQATDLICLVDGSIDRVGKTRELLSDPTFEVDKYGVRFT